MSNNIINNSQALASVASVFVAKDLRLANQINRDFAADFERALGSTVNVRIPASLAADSRAVGDISAYNTRDIAEATQPVALTAELFSRTAVSDADMALSVEDYARQVLLPQAIGLASKVESNIVTSLQAVVEDTTLDAAYDPSDKSQVLDFLVDARAALRAKGSPETGLSAVLSVEAYAALLKATGAASYDVFGTNGAATGRVVNVAGLNVIESNRLAAKEAIIMHQDAVTLALRAPVAAHGVESSSVMAEGGVPLRQVLAFDHTTGQHVSLLSTFAGVATLTASVEGTNQLWIVRVAA
ncbi:P22 phage major capsid protein family protein [Micromonospora sp. NPDC005254]|uniref:P22 phage major capsid protein family protein n=1 Tax=Micromonospora sp. NPDC005254 TaxID=3364229 RepID=UPI0036BD43D4